MARILTSEGSGGADLVVHRTGGQADATLYFRVPLYSLLLISAWVLPARGANYTFTTIDVPNSINTQANGINDTGEIVGNFTSLTPQHTRGFLLSGGSFTTIDVPDSPASNANSINNIDQIVGFFSDPTFPFDRHGFLWDGGSLTTIDVPASIRTYAFGINATGQIVGCFDDASGTHGFLLSGGNFTTIDPPGSLFTCAHGINDAGQIVGEFSSATGVHGFLLSGGSFSPIHVPGSVLTGANGINAAGQIVGRFIDASSVVHGFLFSGGSFTTIDIPHGSIDTEAFGVNAAGQIVGRFFEIGSGNHGFLATPVLGPMDTIAPTVTVSATPATLWPPNGELVSVIVSGTITDSGSGSSGVNPSSAAYMVEDEYGRIQPHGSITLQADGQYAFTIALQASRQGNDADGRQYTIIVSAQDNAGNEGSASTGVTVLHDQRH